MRKLYRNPIAWLIIFVAFLYSIGVPLPYLQRNPCTRYFSSAVYVMFPAEACYTMTPAGWHRVALP
jgi:hypothetical protein